MDRRMTIRSAAGLTSAQIAAKGKKAATDLCVIMGMVMGEKVNDHPVYGKSTGFVGRFRSASLIDGTVRDAPVFWPFHHLADIINGNRAALEPGDVLKLNLKIGVEPNEESTVGYVYTFDFLEEQTSTANMFADMVEAAAKKLPEKIRIALLSDTSLAIEDQSEKPEDELEDEPEDELETPATSAKNPRGKASKAA